MLRNKVVYLLSVVAVVGIGFVGMAISQDSRPAGPDWRNMSREERTKAMSKMMQERMGATDDEWKVLEPKIKKVRDLQQASGNGFGGFGMRGPRGNRPGGGAGADATPPAADPNAPKPSEAQKASDDLRKLLENKDAKPEDLKKALTTLRDARAKAKTELDKARKELQEVLTVRQEAALVSAGVLE
jgi:hypothetical protein